MTPERRALNLSVTFANQKLDLLSLGCNKMIYQNSVTDENCKNL